MFYSLILSLFLLLSNHLKSSLSLNERILCFFFLLPFFYTVVFIILLLYLTLLALIFFLLLRFQSQCFRGLEPVSTTVSQLCFCFCAPPPSSCATYTHTYGHAHYLNPTRGSFDPVWRKSELRLWAGNHIKHSHTHICTHRHAMLSWPQHTLFLLIMCWHSVIHSAGQTAHT